MKILRKNVTLWLFYHEIGPTWLTQSILQIKLGDQLLTVLVRNRSHQCHCQIIVHTSTYSTIVAWPLHSVSNTYFYVRVSFFT